MKKMQGTIQNLPAHPVVVLYPKNFLHHEQVHKYTLKDKRV